MSIPYSFSLSLSVCVCVCVNVRLPHLYQARASQIEWDVDNRVLYKVGVIPSALIACGLPSFLAGGAQGQSRLCRLNIEQATCFVRMGKRKRCDEAISSIGLSLLI
jgi:hypothetical protein